MGRLRTAFSDFYDDNEWTYDKDNPMLEMGFTLESCTVRCYVVEREEQDQITFYVVLPVMATESRRAAVAETITRANYGMILGNFEMDFRDGEVRYKTAIDVSGGSLIQSMVQPMVFAALGTMDRYFPAIQAVMAGAKTPEDAIAEIEG